ncbi:MAG TPA: diguanylate cyclase [Ruminococcaceae bacterium]|nr:diguanylate cyclase [Oscillospiraceae bacterium]
MSTVVTDNEELLKQSFFNVIKNKMIRTVFQPIISLRDGSVYGYEALSRGPADSEMMNPAKLFEYAEKYSKLWELEFLCRTKALETVGEMNKKIKLFLNVNPNIMHDSQFRNGFTKEYLKTYSIDPQDVIFEITEREAVNNNSDFTKAVQNYKNQNYKIAIDDAGAGYSGLNLISDVRPHFIKLDMNLVRDIDKDVTKQSLIKSLCEFASLTNTYLIAEGIETQNELLKLIEVGVHYGQGYFIQRPDNNINPINDGVLNVIKEANIRKNHIVGNRLSDVYINNISRQLKTINPKILVGQIDKMMKEDETLPGFCITDDDNVIGVITRSELYKHISGQYGYNLFCNKPVEAIMDKDFLCVDHKTTINIVAKKAMQRQSAKIYDFITVTKNNKYFGIVTVKDLLEKTIEIEVFNAKHLNPLSELPGNLLIEKQLENCISSKENYCILYFDIDNFKAYNDVYGFENGDRVIKALSDIMKKNRKNNDFLGHIGGDDFLAIISSKEAAQEMCENVIAQFNDEIKNFYNQDDLEKGFITTKNRRGIEESFPLLSVSIAGIHSGGFESIYELSECVGKIKKIVKQKTGSNYLIS